MKLWGSQPIVGALIGRFTPVTELSEAMDLWSTSDFFHLFIFNLNQV